MFNLIKKIEQVIEENFVFYLAFIITFFVIGRYTRNVHFKSIALFIIIFNTLYSSVIYSFYNFNINLDSILNKININIIILTLGFIYKTIIFNYFDINIIYYLTIKDYIIIVLNSVMSIIFIAFLFFISHFFSEYIIQKKHNFFKTEEKQSCLSIVVLTCIILMSFFLLKLLKINILNWQLLNAYLLSSVYFCLTNFIKKKNSQKRIFSFKKSFFMFYLISFFINFAFLTLYNLIGYSQENLIKKGFEYKSYENKYIFKLDSTENYDFYISKPTNNLLIFEKNYNIIKN